MGGSRFVARFVSAPLKVAKAHDVPTGMPNYESGGQEFESFRARHNTLGLLKDFQRNWAAMQNKKIYMATAWQ